MGDLKGYVSGWSDAWSYRWEDPSLFSVRGWHNAEKERNYNDHIMYVNFNNYKPHYVNKLSIQKRGDGKWPDRYLKRVRIKYYDANLNLKCYK